MNRRSAMAGLLATLAGPRAAALLAGLAGRTPRAMARDVPARFPLRLSGNRRYLEDADGRPFLVTGDAAWSLIAQLTLEEAEDYLSHRRAQGFNTLLVNLIEHKFAGNAPANAYGQAPFRAPGRFSEPNDAYFDHALAILRRAESHGFLVLLVPAYLGWQGGPEGWYAAMKKAGPYVLGDYGRHVARRFGALGNIVWVHGGDFDDPDRSLAGAVAAAISAVLPDALHTVHGAPDTATSLYWKGAEWLSIDTVYTYGDVFRSVADAYRREPPLPVLLIESRYENEGDGDAQKMRAQAYGAILAGAAGQIFGNAPVWHFSGPGLFRTRQGWRSALDSPGAASMGHLAELFGGMDWWKIAPDDGRVLLSPPEDAPGLACCGVATDARFAVVYASGRAALHLRLPWEEARPSKLALFDPAAGRFTKDGPEIRPEGGISRVRLPDRPNAGGFRDWVLVARPG